MSNDKKKSAPSTATPAASVEAATPVSEASAIVPATAVELTNSLEYLRVDLPHLADKLARMHVPTKSELQTAMSALTPEEQKQFDEFWTRQTAPKDGLGEGTEQSFTATVQRVKIYQGTGDDQGRPDDCPGGGVYVQFGPTLCVLPDDANRLELPGSFRAAVIGFYNGRTYWPPKDNKGKVQMPPGLSPDHRGPICTSLDRTMGSFYGKCETCPFRPSQGGGGGGDRACVNEVTLFLMLENFEIYRLGISSTSLPTCATPIRTQIENWRMMWECFFQFSTEKKTRDDKRWFVLKSQVAKTKAHPQGVPTTEGFRRMAQYFARLNSTEWYYPTLSKTYADATRNRVARENNSSSDTDAEKALAAAREAASEDQRNNI